MSKPEFTVVIPVRNGANYIAQALQSIFSQTYPNYRILVLENYSTDNTLEIVRGFADARIEIIPASEPLNIEQNWNRIVNLPLSEYFTFIGHDDVLYPTFLEEVASMIEAEPEASLYQVHFEEIDPQGKVVRRPPTIPFRTHADEFLNAVLEGREEVCGTGYVMRTQDYRHIGGIPAFPDLLYADVALWYKLIALSYRVCSPKTLAGYRVHSQSTHRDADLIRYYRSMRVFRDFLLSTVAYQNNPAAAYAYCNHMMQLTYRNAAALAAFSPTPQRIERLKRAKQEILKAGEYTFEDRVGQLYEAIAPLPVPLRQIALLPIRSYRALRLRNQRLL